MASGLIILLINKATKLSSEFLRLSKEYTAVIQLGIETDTLDIEGNILSEKEIGNVSIEDVEKVLKEFRGKIKQLPPMYSALKHDGKPLYKIARTGGSVERKYRDVNINSMELKEFDGQRLTIKVSCSSGTYIRSLASDIGSVLGVGACLYRLNRTRVGVFLLDRSVGIEEFDDIARNGLPDNRKAAVSIEELLKNNPSIYINVEYENSIMNGKRITFNMINTEKTDTGAINELYNNTNRDFYDMVLVRNITGNILSVHRIVDEISKNESGSPEYEFTKSIVIF